jgi:hypothetical protein
VVAPRSLEGKLRRKQQQRRVLVEVEMHIKDRERESVRQPTHSKGVAIPAPHQRRTLHGRGTKPRSLNFGERSIPSGGNISLDLRTLVPTLVLDSRELQKERAEPRNAWRVGFR